MLKQKVNMGFIFLTAAGSLIQLTIQCLCCDCLKVFIELTGAGAIGIKGACVFPDTKYRKQLTRQQVKDHLISEHE